MKATAIDVLSYISEHYIGIDELSKLSGASRERIEELVATRCIPPHSYELNLQATVTSAFGRYQLNDEPVRFYHRSLADWIHVAETLASKHPLAEVSRLVQEKFAADIKTVLGDRPWPWERQIDHAWDFLMDGSFSLCVKELSVEHMMTKELARATIRSIVKPDPDHQLSPNERNMLVETLQDYDSVTLPFSPHEYPESSRALEAEAAAKKYQLNGGILAE